MSNTDRVKYLRFALVVFGLIFVIGIYRSPSFGHPAGLGMLASQIIFR